MRIALAQINTTVGDIAGNVERILHYAQQAAEEGADLVVYPELCITGYPPLDLLHSDYVISAAQKALTHIETHLPDGVAALVGTPVPNTSPKGKRLFNAAVLLERDQPRQVVHKMLLPTYDVFDEYRYFEPAAAQQVMSFRGVRLGVHICEDMWNNEEVAEYHLYDRDPLQELADQGVDLFVNISASPFSHGKHALRSGVIGGICRAHGAPFLVVNQVGANTELIFDGDSRVHAADGTLVHVAPSFEETLTWYDLPEADAITPTALPRPADRIADLHDALVLGIRDYVGKSGAFKQTLVGLSGGIDSAVTAALAAEALGGENVLGVTMPSRFSSKGSVEDSVALADALGMTLHTIPIEPAVEAFHHMLEPLFTGTQPGVAEENIQARARGLTLMAISNKFGHLLLTTGNKSELAMGYATLYGDMSGGLAVLSDVFKTDVFALANYMNRRAGRDIIPQATIDKPPSAELRPDQRDEDSLPPYDELDAILKRYIEYREDVDVIARQTGHPTAFVEGLLRVVDRNEYKRRQAPPGLRVSSKAFGAGRRLPIVMNLDRAAIDALLP
ncbi:MAG: NAD+ synthase [Rhodothermales bacterium]